MTVEGIYEQARRHGLSHDRALDAVAAGRAECWCGSKRPCIGGAQRMIGCPIVSTPETNGRWMQNGVYV